MAIVYDESVISVTLKCSITWYHSIYEKKFEKTKRRVKNRKAMENFSSQFLKEQQIKVNKDIQDMNNIITKDYLTVIS